MFYVYILKGFKPFLFIGITTNLFRKLREHVVELQSSDKDSTLLEVLEVYKCSSAIDAIKKERELRSNKSRRKLNRIHDFSSEKKAG